MPAAAILDIDGTLVDTNYHHAIAWYRAFRRQERIGQGQRGILHGVPCRDLGRA